jgi:hypothetical protein
MKASKPPAPSAHSTTHTTIPAIRVSSTPIGGAAYRAGTTIR